MKLEHCPFCGGEPSQGEDCGASWVNCEECGAGTVGYETQDEASAAWNRRVDC